MRGRLSLLVETDAGRLRFSVESDDMTEGEAEGVVREIVADDATVTNVRRVDPRGASTSYLGP